MIRRPPRPPIKMMQPIALDLANSVTLLTLFGECTLSFLKITNTGKFCLSCLILTMYSLIWIDKRC